MKSHEGRNVFLTEHRIEAMLKSGAWSNKTLTDYFDNWARKDPERTAIISHSGEKKEQVTVSFGALYECSMRIAANLVRYDIGLGDVVSFQLNNRWEFIAISLACVRVGAIANPLMPVLREKELTYMLSLSETKMLIVPKTFRGFDFKSMALRLKKKLPALLNVFVLDDNETTVSFSNLTEEDFVFNDPTSTDPNEVMQLLFTSGTTGEPKGAMHTANTLFANIVEIVKRLGCSREEVIFCPTPMAHQLGYLFGLMLPIFTGATVVLQDIWNPDIAVMLIEEQSVTMCVGATPFLADLAGHDGIERTDLTNFRMFVSGGAPIPPALVRSAKRNLQAEIISVWGMTEVLVMTIVKPGDPEEKVFGSDGVAVDHVAVRVVDNEGHIVDVGEEGSLEATGASICVGYLKRPNLYTINEEVWFETGDLAKMDEDGYIRITGRSKDIIIRGGENIPVVEIENVLYQHDAILQVAIVAMPDLRLGERACAFIVLKKGSSFSMSDMTAYLEALNIAKVYYPERLEVLDAMPMTVTGKIQKFELRERARIFSA